MRLPTTLLLATSLLALAAPADAFSAPETPNLVDTGGYCNATIHIGCYHETAWGLCVLYVGGSDGSCIIYEGGATYSQAAAQPDIVDVGGYCTALVHLECNHYTALGTCHLYVGGASGACIAYGEGIALGTIYDHGGECNAEIHTGCNHWSGLGMCALYVGGPDGRCILYEG